LLLFAVAQETGEVSESRASAQATNLHQWGAVTLFHGLPSDRVRAIAQDGEGVMWFGTDAGLARYDGRRTQTIAEGGLSGRRIFALRFDREGALWIGTDAGAAVRLSSGEYRRIDETEGKAVTSLHIVEEAAETGVVVVLATSAGELFYCRLKENVFETRVVRDRLLLGVGTDNRAASEAETRAPLEVTSAVQRGSTLFVGTRGRGFLAVEESGTVREVYSRPRAYFVEAALGDAQGRIWFGAQTTGGDSGLYESDETLEHPAKVLAGATGTVKALSFDSKGDLYVGTDGQGVFRYRGRTRLEHFTFGGTKGGLRSDHVYSIFIDREGVAWFGTDRGVCRYDPHALRNESLSEDAASGISVRTLFQTSRGRLLAGTTRGLFVREPTSATTAAWRSIEALSNKTVYAIEEDAGGLLLVGASSGLYVGLRPAPAVETTEKLSTARTTPGDKTPTTEPAVAGSVRAIESFRGSTYIATYGRGVERLERTEERLRRTFVWPAGGDASAATTSQARNVLSLHADDAGGLLWIGTAGAGVFVYDGGQVRTDPALAPLQTRSINSIGGSPDRGLWLATERGLYLYRAGTLTEAVPDVDARSVVDIPSTASSSASAAQTRAQAWCATAGGGLLKVSVDELFGVMVARFDVEQGLPSQQAFSILHVRESRSDANRSDASGEASIAPAGFAESSSATSEALWIGTARGVSRYEPGRFSPAVRATRITGARAHQPEELGAGLRLEYPQNSLVLDVAATSSRTFPEQFQYAFLLYDDAGRVIKRKLAHDAQFQVESLRAGRYRVEARAYTADLIPSAPLAFDLHVARAPFPWTTTALSVLLSLAVVALVWGSVQNARLARTGKALMEANRQLAAARLQLANETEAERRRIARDLHDQTLADLRRLILLTDQLPAVAGASSPSGSNGDHQHETIEPARLRTEIESISNEIRRICEDLSPSVLENVGFAAALEWAVAERVAHLPADCRFTYEFVCDDELEERLRLSPGVQMQIYRIVQEAVSNICRHAAASQVRLKVDLDEEDNLLLLLEDDGRGFDLDNKRARGGRGLANIRARAIIIQAEVGWHKRPDNGTVFTLRKKIESRSQTA
jgi:signal transduction histidine kinase/ligand-binding sensor domain-containing protein